MRVAAHGACRIAELSFAPSGLDPWNRSYPTACAVGCILSPLRGSGTHAGQDDVAHLLRKLFGGAVEARAVPGVDPVDHAEQAHDGGTGIEVELLLALEVIDQPEAN